MADDEQKNEAKVVAGKLGGAARAEALTSEERREIAVRAAAARWGGKLQRATHRGSFSDEFGIDVDCYVLDDEQKTAVISQRGMGQTLGLGTSGSRLPEFVNSKRMAKFVGRELREKLDNPLIFQSPSAGGNQAPPSKINGYDVTILIDICKAILQADDDGALLERQKRIVRQAHVILNASAKAGIKGLVYALAGYDPTKQEVIEAFKFFVREEAREYEKEFPNQLYDEWYRLYELPRPEKNKPWKFKHLTVEQVYMPLARSNGKILQLTRAQRAKSDRWAKLHQFLSEIGVKALRTHLGQLLGIAQVSDDQEAYERNFERVFGRQMSLDFPKR
jgi:hypothetical protein